MIRLFAAAIFFLTFAAARADESTPSPEAAATVVIYNRNDKASAALAKYYAGRRNIPASQLVGLACSSEEEISRDEYLVDIEAPLRDAFAKRGWWKISIDPEGHRYVESASMRFAALIRGVPMKIRSNAKEPPSTIYTDIQPGTPMQTLLQHNEASVDSELAAMFTLLEEAPAVIGNSYFRRFAHILNLPPTKGPFLVCRLDGPSDAIVREMIDDAIATEKSGLWGWAYLDARNITSGGYAEGDDWIASAGKMMRRRGIPVISDYAPEILPEGFPVTNAAIYYGWYIPDIAGPFAKADFRFVPGAVAVHIHSYSARTIRAPGIAWAGPLLFHGAAATMGNVYEPYLSLTVHFDVLQDRLMNGFTLAESAYAATPGLSWMDVVLGDPLYRPYAAWNSLETDDDGTPTLWQRYRTVVLHAGDPLAAADALRKLAAVAHSSMPLEALGQAQGAARQFDDAVQTLDEAAKIEKSQAIRFRIALEQIELLRRAGRIDDALKKISTALGVFGTNEQQVTLGNIVLAIRPPPPPKPKPHKQ
jgi:uncharacterized protein (TIGR03790 family)